ATTAARGGRRRDRPAADRHPPDPDRGAAMTALAAAAEEVEEAVLVLVEQPPSVELGLQLRAGQVAGANGREHAVDLLARRARYAALGLQQPALRDLGRVARRRAGGQPVDEVCQRDVPELVDAAEHDRQVLAVLVELV